SGDIRTDGDAFGRAVRVERLCIGVDGDELDPFQAKIDHRVNGVSARTTYADNLDASLILLGLVGEFDRETHDLFSRGRKCCFTSNKKPTADRKSTRLNSSHVKISYAVFCLKQKR